MSEDTPTDIRKQLEDFWKQRVIDSGKTICLDCFKNWLDIMVEHVFDWIDLDGELEQTLKDTGFTSGTDKHG